MHFFYKFTIENKKGNKKFLDLDNFFSLASSTTTPPTNRENLKPKPTKRRRIRPRPRPPPRPKPRMRHWHGRFSYSLHRRLQVQESDQDPDQVKAPRQSLDPDQE